MQLGAGPEAECEGQQSEERAEGRHQNRPQPDASGVRDRRLERLALFVQMFGKIEQHDAVFDHKADQKNQAHRGRHVQIGAGENQERERAAQRQRRGNQNQRRGDERAELHDEHRKHQKGADAKHHQQLAKRLPLRFVLTADFVGIADRQRQLRQRGSNISHCAAQIAALETAGHAGHAAQVLPQQLGLAIRSDRLGHRGNRHQLSPTCANQCLRQLDWVESKRVGQPDSDRHLAIRQAQLGRDFAEPRTSELIGDILNGQTKARARDRIDLPGHFRIAFLHPDHVDDAVDLAEHGFHRFGEARQLVWIVTENLDIDGRRGAFQVAELILKELNELHIGERRGFVDGRP